MNNHNALHFWSDALQLSRNMPYYVATKRLSSAIKDVCSEIQKQIANNKKINVMQRLNYGNQRKIKEIKSIW